MSSCAVPVSPLFPMTAAQADQPAFQLDVHDLIWVSHEIIHGAYWYYCSGCGSLHFREPQNSFHLACIWEVMLYGGSGTMMTDDPDLFKMCNGFADMYIPSFNSVFEKAMVIGYAFFTLFSFWGNSKLARGFNQFLCAVDMSLYFSKRYFWSTLFIGRFSFK